MSDLFDILDEDTKLNQQIEYVETEQIHIVDSYTLNNTVHEATTRNLLSYTPLDINMAYTAKTYPFELDTFQKIALAAIEADRSVLVSAHTSCGKTVVAEYAIAKSIANKQRVIYTSPIKALSNQKFRELQEEFGDVGLMTGDVTLNPDATCLVMTTEILRNMLYRGAELTREIHWIIFDEIHYLKDRERGVVWEECIILLKDYVRLIFLSATIPNAREFAEWITKVHNQTVHVCYTEKRVIPLVHYFYSDRMYLVKDGRGTNGLDMEAVTSSQEAVIKRADTAEILATCLDTINLPAVVFSFARSKCEYFASKITRTLLTQEESTLAETIFNNAIQSLSAEDQSLLAVQTMRELFIRGIGVHHSGLLPIVKEIGEILFQEGLIKILFATESFSIGLNMPAKSVVFTSLKKYDGQEERMLTSAEYCQMSGRAGRRGLDDLGCVISMVTDKFPSDDLRNMFKSATDPLNSAFRLTYNMILNLMRIEELDPTYFLGKSFYHYQAYAKAKRLSFTKVDYADDFSCLAYINKINRIKMHVAEHLHETNGGMYDHNRLVEVTEFRDGFFRIISPAILLVHKKTRHNDGDTVTIGFVVNDEFIQKEVNICCITGVYAKKLKKTSDLRKVDITKVKRIGEGEPPANLKESVDKLPPSIRNAYNLMASGYCVFCNKKACDINSCLTTNIQSTDQYLQIVINNIKNKEQTKKLKTLSELREIYHMAECTRMIGVLRDLDFLDGNSVQLKGKMASEISSADEILLTEMIFNSSFNSLSIENMVALISILVTERSKEGSDIVLSDENIKIIELFNRSIDKIVACMNVNGIPIKSSEYISGYSFYMMDIVKLWIGGAPFGEITKCTKVFEGSIIRSFKRLEEVLRQLSNAASVIGNNELVNLFGQGIYLIKRDIVFANSLYI